MKQDQVTLYPRTRFNASIAGQSGSPLKKYLVSKLPRRFREMHINHRRIAWGMLLIGILTMTAKAMVALKEMAIAWRYGVGSGVDAYFLAMTITTWLPLVLCSTGVVVLVPRLMAMNNPSERSRFISELNGMVVILGIAMVTLSMLFEYWGPQFSTDMTIDEAIGGISTVTRDRVRSMTWQLSPLAMLTLFAGVLSIRLQAREQFGYALMEAVPALSIVAFILFASDGMDLWPLIWGTLFGAVAQTLWLGFLTHRADDGLGHIAIAHDSPCWRGFYGGLGLMALGQLIAALPVPIDQIFAAQIGEGAIATLGYTNRIIAFAIGIGTLIIGRVLLPVLSEVAARGEYDLGRTQAMKWSWLMFVIWSGVTLFGWLLAPWGVRLLFERGAFTAENTAAITLLLRFGLLQLPFYCAGVVLVQWLAALGRYKELLVITIGVLCAKVGLNVLLVDAYALVGIMLSTSGSAFVLLALSVFYVKANRESAIK
jgi:peptidoglycan biosynthesis protein MviN/MurJ (putative lipid II flippase)